MQELFAYDEKAGLFKQVLNNSFVMGGRYHVSDNSGQDLNTSNLQALTDGYKGQKYPLAVCMAPKSVTNMVNGQRKEMFYFTMLFLCTTYFDSTGVKSRSPETGTSTHPVWYDWQDMATAANDFIIQVDKVTRKCFLANGKLIITEFNIQPDVEIRRLTKIGTDRTSGVVVYFSALMSGDDCLQPDYENFDFANFTVPPSVIHQQHKQ